MPGSQFIAQSGDVRYIYDGSLAGFYCCVYESIYSRELPAGIFREEEAEPALLREKMIMTDEDRARRVRASVPAKVSVRALELVETVFLSCLPNKELAMLRFLRLAYQEGSKVTEMLGHPVVNSLLKAENHLLREQHLLLGFVRFADYGGMLVATITPKNFVLPFMARHFVSRYSGENFIIFDKTHKAALVYRDGKPEILAVEALALDAPSEAEQQFQSLWKRFYDTIAIKERINPKCRMTHMPKRYWENMTEVRDLV